jgi:hypothetical protein
MSSATETLSKPEEIYQRAKLTAKQKKKLQIMFFTVFGDILHQMKIYKATYQVSMSRQKPNGVDHIHGLLSLMMDAHE